jgi:hypothetical protein
LSERTDNPDPEFAPEFAIEIENLSKVYAGSNK